MKKRISTILFFALTLGVTHVWAQNIELNDEAGAFGRIASEHTITTLPWEEDFTDVDEFQLPEGWEADQENWYVFNSENAGGTAPEMVFWWEPEFKGRSYLLSPPMNSEEWENLKLSFKYNIRNFGDPGEYTLSVIAIAGDDEYVIAEWVDPGDSGPSEIEVAIDSENHGLGHDEFRLAWVFDGPSNNITGWNIDDIKLIEDQTDTNTEVIAEVPDGFRLEQNHPNPFNPSTTISFTLAQDTNVELNVYNLAGQRVATIINGEQRQAGQHSAIFDAGTLSSGVYVYRLQTDAFVQSKKMVLVK